MFLISGIACLLFLGGWHTGLVPFELSAKLGVLGHVINVVVFILKGWILVFVMMWVRWTLPRLRIDQVMMTCIKYLVPISCFLLVAVSLWHLFMPEVVQKYVPFVIAGLCVLTFVLTLVRALTSKGTTPTAM